MGEHLIEKFWDDYFKYTGQRHTRFALKNLLLGYRQILKENSRTAISIEGKQPLEEIIKCAKEEQYIEFAQTIKYAKDHMD